MRDILIPTPVIINFKFYSFFDCVLQKFQLIFRFWTWKIQYFNFWYFWQWYYSTLLKSHFWFLWETVVARKMCILRKPIITSFKHTQLICFQKEKKDYVSFCQCSAIIFVHNDIHPFLLICAIFYSSFRCLQVGEQWLCLRQHISCLFVQRQRENRHRISHAFVCKSQSAHCQRSRRGKREEDISITAILLLIPSKCRCPIWLSMKILRLHLLNLCCVKSCHRSRRR